MIFVGLTLFTAGISYWIWVDVREERYKDLAYTASVIKRYFELSFYQMELSLLSVGQRLLDIRGEDADVRRLNFANEALEIYDDLLAFGLADTTGQITTLTGSEIGDTLPNLSNSLSTRRSFHQAKSAEGLVIGESYYFREVNDWIIPIRVPIRDENNILLALNTSAVAYNSLIESFESFQFNDQYQVQVVNTIYNTTQIYYPMEISQYDSLLHQDADIFHDMRVVREDDNQTLFAGYNAFRKYPSIGVKTSPGAFDHLLVVSVKKSILWVSFWEFFRLILAAYLFMTILTLIAFRFFRNKEIQYTHELQAERDYSTNILNRSPALIVGINMENKCTYINPVAERVTGYRRKDIIGRDWWETLFPEKYDNQVTKFFDQLKVGPVRDFEMTMLTNEGKDKIVSWYSMKLYDEKSQPKEIIIFGRDVTEQKEAEERLMDREANLKSLFESTNSIIGLFDTNKRLIEFNQAFADYAKQTDGLDLYSGMDIFNEAWGDKPIAKAFFKFQERALKGEKFKETVEYPTPQGSLYFLFNYNPIYQGDEITGVSMFVEDITALKQSEKELENYSKNLETLVKERTVELEKTNKELQDGNLVLKKQREELEITLNELSTAQKQLIQAEKMASLGVLAAGVGHEINNPLNYIKNGVSGMLNHIQKNARNVKDGITPYFDIINDGVKRASDIVKSLSHFSRQGGEMDETCDLHEIIDNCLVILHNKVKNRINVIREFTDQPAIVRGSEGKLHQAFLNLFSNAEQAITGEGMIRIKTIKNKKEIIIEISDTGEGISVENMSRIGDPFFTTKAPGVGTGLGLSITYSIIEEHNGNIDVTSKLNQGSTFTVTLPSSQPA